MTTYTNAYSPFDRELKDLKPDDLATLRQVAEGWYVEYKREITDARSIAKSISAFANTYGGWLFYGIEEESKENPVAGKYPGVPRADVDAAIQRIRQAAANHATPSPHFEHKVVFGPQDGIGLAEDRCVICIRIPWSAAAPHVHKSGLIYRRVSDGSEPQAENDRFALDQLWHRADRVREHYAQWINRDPELPEGDMRPLVRLMLVADLWRERDLWMDISLPEVRDFFAQGPIPLDTIYTSGRGFVARQCRHNNPQYPTFTWRFNQGLVSDVLIPFNCAALERPEDVAKELRGYRFAKDFATILSKHGYQRPRIVDLNSLFGMIYGVVQMQHRILSRAKWSESFFFRARMINVGHVCPFVDVKPVLEGFDSHGVPLCLDSTVTIPPDFDPMDFIKMPAFDDVESESERLEAQTIYLFSLVAVAFGLPTVLHGENTHDGYYRDLLEAGHRSMDAMKRS